MITPSFALTATERVLPNMALDFITASLDSRITFTRSGNTATATNSSGVIAVINANLPRFDYNPTTLVCNGLLVEESRTNLLLNSLIDGTNLSTQIVVTAAVANTLSFYGTGQIVLTGTSSATVVGTGAYPSRKTLTFTPTVGALTLTVTGTVQYAQLETGTFATSFIPTAGSQVTRTVDVASMTSTNFSSWYNATQGSFALQYNQYASIPGNKSIFTVSASTNANQATLLTATASDRALYFVDSGGGNVANINAGNMTLNATNRQTVAYQVNNFRMAVNGAATVSDTAGALPIGVDRLLLGTNAAGLQWSGWLQGLRYWPQRLTNNEIQAFSKV
jgi:hypothetical protein